MHIDFVSKKVFDILWGVFFWTPLLTSTHFYKVLCVNLSFYQVIQSSVMLQRSIKSIIVPLGPFTLSFISNRSFTYIFSISCECSDYHRNPPTKKGFHFPETLFTLSKKPSRFPAGRPINFHYAVWKAPLKSVLLPGRCACLSVTFRVRGAKRKNVERHATRRLAEIFINKPCFEKKRSEMTLYSNTGDSQISLLTTCGSLWNCCRSNFDFISSASSWFSFDVAHSVSFPTVRRRAGLSDYKLNES